MVSKRIFFQVNFFWWNVKYIKIVESISALNSPEPKHKASHCARPHWQPLQPLHGALGFVGHSVKATASESQAVCL